MGRIKSLMIKRAAKQLLGGENSFGEHFNGNKKILGSTMPSKSVRNKIAGYLGRIKRMEAAEKAGKKIKKVALEAPEPEQYQ